MLTSVTSLLTTFHRRKYAVNSTLVRTVWQLTGRRLKYGNLSWSNKYNLRVERCAVNGREECSQIRNMSVNGNGATDDAYTSLFESRSDHRWRLGSGTVSLDTVQQLCEGLQGVIFKGLVSSAGPLKMRAPKYFETSVTT